MKNIKLINLRVLAILLVVFGHSIIIYSPFWGYYNSIHEVPILAAIKDIINVIQMPLFFSISGYLFCNALSKKITFKKIIFNKCKRLIIPFLLIGLCWMIPIKILINYSNYNGRSIFGILKTFIFGQDLGHLWYLPTLFIIFIIMYLFNKLLSLIKTNKKIDLLILIVLFILSLFASKYHYHIFLNNPAIYLLYFYVGLLVNKYEKKVLSWNRFLISIIFAILMYAAVRLFDNTLNCLTAIIGIVALYKILPNKTNKVFSIVDRNSFGIYLFHSPLIYITYYFFANTNPIFVVFLNFLVFGILSIVLTELIRKTKLKFILGE